MADIMTMSQRSQRMALIKSTNTKLERFFLGQVSKKLYPQGFRYRKHYKALPGKPDLVFVSQRLAVFIDGDFWHGRHFETKKHKLPKEYWLPKITRNMERDQQVSKLIRKMGWKVIRLWEGDIKKNPDKAVLKISRALATRKF